MISMTLAIFVFCEMCICGFSMHAVPRNLKARHHHGADQHADAIVSDEKSAAQDASTAAHHRADGRGGYAPLTEAGYQQVAVLKSDEEMAKFIRRVVESEGKVVGSEGDLTGFAPFYSGTEMVQTLDQLQKEIAGSAWVLKEGASFNAPSTDEGRHKGEGRAEEQKKKRRARRAEHRAAKHANATKSKADKKAAPDWNQKHAQKPAKNDEIRLSATPPSEGGKHARKLSQTEEGHSSAKVQHPPRKPEPKAAPSHATNESLFGGQHDARKHTGKVLHVHAQDVLSAKQFAGGAKFYTSNASDVELKEHVHEKKVDEPRPNQKVTKEKTEKASAIEPKEKSTEKQKHAHEKKVDEQRPNQKVTKEKTEKASAIEPKEKSREKQKQKQIDDEHSGDKATKEGNTAEKKTKVDGVSASKNEKRAAKEMQKDAKEEHKDVSEPSSPESKAKLFEGKKKDPTEEAEEEGEDEEDEEDEEEEEEEASEVVQDDGKTTVGSRISGWVRTIVR